MADLIGLPYVYGGRDAAGGKLDCAGFVLEAYWRQDINLSHVPVWPDDPTRAERRYPEYALGKIYTSAQRLYDSPRIPHVQSPRPGDLAFWERTYTHVERITHVMLWAGPDRYVGAQSPNLGEYPNNDAFWRSRLVGYGRPIR